MLKLQIKFGQFSSFVKLTNITTGQYKGQDVDEIAIMEFGVCRNIGAFMIQNKKKKKK